MTLRKKRTPDDIDEFTLVSEIFRFVEKKHNEGGCNAKAVYDELRINYTDDQIKLAMTMLTE